MMELETVLLTDGKRKVRVNVCDQDSDQWKDWKVCKKEVDEKVDDEGSDHENDNDNDFSLEDRVSEYHTGGGYYEFPNGEKVRGKEKAMECLKLLLDGANAPSKEG